MDISRPQYTHLRFDPNISEIIGNDKLRCSMGFHNIVSPPNKDFDKYIIGARCTFAFYTETSPHDVASYLGEVLSVVENGSNAIGDRKRLMHLAVDLYNGFLTHIQSKAPYLGMDFAPRPDYDDFVDDWVKILSEQGFY